MADRPMEFLDLLTVTKVAANPKAGWQQVRKMIAYGEIEAGKVGREYRVPLDALAAWLERNRD